MLLAAVLGVLALGYAVYIWRIYTTRGLFEYIGGDYRTYRASAEIARALGFERVYDLPTQAEFQRPLYAAYSFGLWRIPFAPTPTPYLPAFIVPFLWLPLFAPVPGFAAWTALNAGVLLLYLHRLATAAGGGRPRSLPYEFLVSLPVCTNLVLGQVNVWLLIFTGEFLLAGIQRERLRSGMWLAGMLMKPQSLVLFLPGLLIGRRFRILVGWAIAAGLVVAASLALAGVQGMTNLVQLVRMYPGNLPTTFPQSMMNWRAVTINQALILSPRAAWKLGMAGLAMTLTLGLAIWLRPVVSESSQFALLVLGTWTATAGVAWHSHVYMAMPMIAPLLFLALRQQLPLWLVRLWILLPSAVFLEEGFRIGPGAAHVAASLALLAVNSLILGWVVKALWTPARVAEVSGVASAGTQVP